MEIVSSLEPVLWKQFLCRDCRWTVTLGEPIDRRVVCLFDARARVAALHDAASPDCKDGMVLLVAFESEN